ncbi:MAG: hypothetical protein IKT42_03270 [Clostridia bacterium]|nr:hypothetical protein [Clostridia bacterium]
MKKYLLPTDCNSYKANMHCHSTLSDGSMTPEELKETYKSAGYSVLAITDHEGIFDHSYLDDANFLTIPSYEREINADANCWNNVITCHLCIYPKDRSNINTIAYDPEYTHPKFKWLHNAELKENMTYLGEPYKPYYSVESINYIISEAKKYGFLVTLNHLQWSQERYGQFSQYKGYDAVEVFNSASACGGLDMDDSLYYDSLLHLGNKIRCVCADDNHEPHHCFGGWIVIKAPALNHENIMRAFEKGEYYSSTGPEINELYVEDGKVHIGTSNVKYIRMLTGNRLSKLAKATDQNGITEAVFELRGVQDYFRIEIMDNNGNKAYTNAYFEGDF